MTTSQGPAPTLSQILAAEFRGRSVITPAQVVRVARSAYKVNVSEAQAATAIRRHLASQA